MTQEILKIQIENPKEIEKLLKSQSPRMREAAMQASEDMVFEADRLAKEHARDKNRKPILRTGRYFNSIHPEITRAQFKITGAIASNVNYAPALEDGSKPHVIRPKKKKALAFGKQIGSLIADRSPLREFVVKKVNHPGTPAFKVLTGAAEDVVDRADEFLEKAMKRKFNK